VAADASAGSAVRFEDIGTVELKGLSEPVHLLRAHSA